MDYFNKKNALWIKCKLFQESLKNVALYVVFYEIHTLVILIGRLFSLSCSYILNIARITNDVPVTLFQGSPRMLGFLFSTDRNETSASNITSLWVALWGCFLNVIVFVFVTVFLLVRSCLLITLINCHKGHKSLGIFSCSVFNNGYSLSYKVTYRAVLGTAKKANWPLLSTL